MHTIKIMTILLITRLIYDTLKRHAKFKKKQFKEVSQLLDKL